MNPFAELREMPESRRLSATYLLVLLVWAALVFILVNISRASVDVGKSISSGDQIINSAITYKSYPSKGQPAAAAPTGEPLTVLSEIVNTLGMRERMIQLQSNVSGIMLQIEKLYGSELEEFLATIESRGLKVKTAEIKVLPVAGERLLAITLLLEQSI